MVCFACSFSIWCHLCLCSSCIVIWYLCLPYVDLALRNYIIRFNIPVMTKPQEICAYHLLQIFPPLKFFKNIWSLILFLDMTSRAYSKTLFKTGFGSLIPLTGKLLLNSSVGVLQIMKYFNFRTFMLY